MTFVKPFFEVQLSNQSNLFSDRLACIILVGIHDGVCKRHMKRTASLGVIDVSSDGVFPNNTGWNGLEDSTRPEKVCEGRGDDLR